MDNNNSAFENGSYDGSRTNEGREFYNNDERRFKKEGYDTGKRLYRSNTNAMLLGICGGMGNYFNCDPTVVRLIFLLFGFCSVGTGLVVYLIMGAIIPKSPYNE